jgi:hypothetical protein
MTSAMTISGSALTANPLQNMTQGVQLAKYYGDMSQICAKEKSQLSIPYNKSHNQHSLLLLSSSLRQLEPI